MQLGYMKRYSGLIADHSDFYLSLHTAGEKYDKLLAYTQSSTYKDEIFAVSQQLTAARTFGGHIHPAYFLDRKDVVLRLERPERSICELDDISFKILFNFFPAIPQGKRAYAHWLEYSARYGFSKYKQTVHPDFKALVDVTSDGKDTLIMWHGMDGFCLDSRRLEVADTYTEH